MAHVVQLFTSDRDLAQLSPDALAALQGAGLQGLKDWASREAGVECVRVWSWSAIHRAGVVWEFEFVEAPTESLALPYSGRSSLPS